MQASCAHCGLLVLIAGLLSLSQNRWRTRRMRQSHKTDSLEHVTSLRLTLSDVPQGVASRRGGRLERAPLPGRGRFPHPSTRRHSWMRLPVLCAELLHQASQNGVFEAPDAVAVAALAALIDAARGAPGDDGIRCSTQTPYHHHTH